MPITNKDCFTDNTTCKHCNADLTQENSVAFIDPDDGDSCTGLLAQPYEGEYGWYIITEHRDSDITVDASCAACLTSIGKYYVY